MTKKFSTLRDILITMKPFDIAAVFENLQDEKMPILFRILPKELAAETFVEMDDETQEFLIHGFSDSELKRLSMSYLSMTPLTLLRKCLPML